MKWPWCGGSVATLLDEIDAFLATRESWVPSGEHQRRVRQAADKVVAPLDDDDDDDEVRR